MTNSSSGPRISFPAIEKAYGLPIGEGMEIIAASPLTKNSEVIGWLKTEHGVGHGHAMALVHRQKENNEHGGGPRSGPVTAAPDLSDA